MDLIRELLSDYVCRTIASDEFNVLLQECALSDQQVTAMQESFRDGQFESFRKGISVTLRLLMEAGLA